MNRSKDGTDLEDSAKFTMKYSDNVASLFINFLEPDDAGRVTCKASNEFGSVKTSADLTIEGIRHRRKRREEAEEAYKKKKCVLIYSNLNRL